MIENVEHKLDEADLEAKLLLQDFPMMRSLEK